MKCPSSKRLAALAVALAIFGGPAAWAEQYRVVATDAGTICDTGTKTEPVVIEGPDDVMIASAEGDSLNTAVCVSDGSQSNVHVQWRAGGAWKSTGNVIHSCVEILGASTVMVRAVDTGDVQSATYYTCGVEPAAPAQ
jgi:hypothetical protein